MCRKSPETQIHVKGPNVLAQTLNFTYRLLAVKAEITLTNGDIDVCPISIAEKYGRVIN